MENTETVAQEALRLLLPIPKEDFITDDFTDKVGKCCAIGHIVRLKSDDPTDYSNCDDYDCKIPIRRVSREFIEKTHNISYTNIATVNNIEGINGYIEDNPKDRVIHLLEDMVAAGL